MTNQTNGPSRHHVQNASDEAIIELVKSGQIHPYQLESFLGSREDSDGYTRAVRLRRKLVGQSQKNDMREIPFEGFDYEKVFGQCCENVVGYVPVPVGVVGPLRVDGEELYVPMATTEGCLVASVSRGCKAINAGGGASSVLVADGMTRGPVVQFGDILGAAECKRWIESEKGFEIIKSAFESTSRFAKLLSCKVTLAGRLCFIRFKAFTGDAMGMNMISKGSEKALEAIHSQFPKMKVVSLSGNFCTDKKPAAVNWIEGRGKSVVAAATIPGHVVNQVLKTTVKDLVTLNVSKNLIGSAMAGAIGGFNAHAANIVTAIFLATGQDVAQNVESSNCITVMEEINEGNDLYISVTMPSIEVGTIGGGTCLPAQGGFLDLLGIKGPSTDTPGAHSQKLARIVCATVLAGELSLCSALAAGHLVQSHMAHNRATTTNGHK